MQQGQRVRQYLATVQQETWDACSREEAAATIAERMGGSRCRLYLNGVDIFTYLMRNYGGELDNTVMTLYIPGLRQYYINILHQPNRFTAREIQEITQLSHAPIPEFESAYRYEYYDKIKQRTVTLSQYFPMMVMNEYNLLQNTSITKYDVVRITGREFFNIIVGTTRDAYRNLSQAGVTTLVDANQRMIGMLLHHTYIGGHPLDIIIQYTVGYFDTSQGNILYQYI